MKGWRATVSHYRSPESNVRRSAISPQRPATRVSVEDVYDNIGALTEVPHLPLFQPPFREPAATLLAQHLVYVSGGSTSHMLAVWRLYGIDELLEQARNSGMILYGGGAGGICW